MNKQSCILLFVVFAFTGLLLQPRGARSGVVEEDSDTPTFRLREIEDEIGYEMTLVGYAPDQLVHESESEYQTIEVYNHDHFGKILVLDGNVQLTEEDADSYNEMLAHVPMFAYGHGDGARRVLVVGAGDGYVVHEVLKHKSVTHVDHVELDEGVIRACKQHFVWGKAWDDPRVHLHISDGAAFLRDAPDNTYDVIIQDSSDPFHLDDDGAVVKLTSHVLYEPSHLAHAERALTESGVFAFQAETYNVPSSLEGVKAWRRAALDAGFAAVRYGTIATGSYPMGQIGFLVCRKKQEDASFSSIVQRFAAFQKPTTYYHPRLQRSCFDLPLWVEHDVYGEEQCKSEYVDKEE